MWMSWPSVPSSELYIHVWSLIVKVTIHSVRRSLPSAALQSLAVSLVLSRLDYGNSIRRRQASQCTCYAACNLFWIPRPGYRRQPCVNFQFQLLKFGKTSRRCHCIPVSDWFSSPAPINLITKLLPGYFLTLYCYRHFCNCSTKMNNKISIYPLTSLYCTAQTDSYFVCL